MSNIPTAITKGDTVSWQLSLADYPASGGWSLTYHFRGSASLDKTASLDGDDYNIKLTSSETSGLIAGEYHWSAKVSDGTSNIAVANALAPLPVSKFDKFNQPSWRPRGWSWVDPQKEASANQVNIDMGVESLTAIAAEQGRDIEEIMQERQTEIRLAEKYGIHLNNNKEKQEAKNNETTEDE